MKNVSPADAITPVRSRPIAEYGNQATGGNVKGPGLMQHRFAHFLLCLALTGCAASQVRDEQTQLAAARSCCASFHELPPAVKADAGKPLLLGPESPHFDFGDGLAPFVRISIAGSDAEMLSVYSHADNSAWLTGSYGTFKYVAVMAIFLDADGHEISRSSLSEPEAAPVGNGWIKLRRSVVIPEGSASVVFASNLSEIGRDGSAGYRSRESAMMVGGAYVLTGGGAADVSYLLSVYGKFHVERGYATR